MGRIMLFVMENASPIEWPPRQISDVMDPARAQALSATLGCDHDPGAALIPFAHQIYFWEALPPARLGRDGHPARGEVLPDLGLPRRMWAGGRLEFHAPLIAGQAAEKTTTLEAATRKQGRSGPLAFVTMRHEVRQGGQLCVTEWQDIVYREDPAPDAPAPVPPHAAEGRELTRRSFDATALFRYSALTFNGHRIHYDPPYAREVEGYGGLVVHGPLLAQVLMLLAQEDLGGLSRFDFRATAPLIAGEEARFLTDGSRYWIAGPDGRQCMEATARA